MGCYKYDKHFFDFVDTSSGKSAISFVRKLIEGYRPTSVLDVGCGRGAWLSAWSTVGILDFLGVDGAYVNQATLSIPSSAFIAHDVTVPFNLDRMFDLVECLEVAEHIAEENAEILLDNLVRHGTVILFSAAQPGQGGEQHINEQPLGYWMSKFYDRGYLCYDFPRRAVRQLTDIEPWYRYNTVLFANAAGQTRLPQIILDSRIERDISSEYFSFLWKARCAILQKMPSTAVHYIARMKHRVMNSCRGIRSS